MKHYRVLKLSILLSGIIVSISSGVLWKPVLMPLDGIAKFFREVSEEIKFRHYTVVQYRDQVSLKFSNAIDKFSKLQVMKSNDAVQDIESYVKQFHQVYDETVNLIEQQKKIINDLDLKIINRPAQFYESLDRFRKSYDESISKAIPTTNTPPSSIDTRRKALKTNTRKQKPRKVTNKKKGRTTSSTIDTTITNFFDRLSNSLSVSQTNELLNTKTFHQQIEIIKNILGQEVKTVTQQILDPIMTNRLDANIQLLLNEFNHIQEDISHKASMILSQSQQAIAESINKKDVLQEKKELEKNLKLLEKNFNAWIDENKANLEEKLNAIKDKISITNTLYEEIIGRKKVELEIQEMNDRILRKILNMIDPNAPGKMNTVHL